MKRIIAAALLISMGAIAEDAAKVEEPATAEVNEGGGGHKDWPSLDEWFENNKLNEGALSAEVLIGYEYSDLSGNATDSAHALLTRTRLNYQTANFEGFDARIQAQYIGPINDHYSYPGGGNPNYDVVADPEDFRLHQAYLAYTGYDTHGRIGPQEIILDNARFIGNVGWRLNAQSFNAGLVKNNSIENLTLLYSYADSINTILGTTDHNRQYHMLNGEYKLGDNNKASAFAYLQRNDNPGALERLDTYGGRFWGKGDAFAYDAAAGLQRSAYYGYLKLNMDIKQVNVGVGSEYISGGGGNENFQTLNGTAHKFNGWADQFAAGPTSTGGGGLNSGLIDFWGEGSIMVAEKLKLMGVYHLFNTAYNTPATSFSGIYGHEFDFQAKYPVCKNFDVLAKLAYYIKEDDAITNLTNDETVFWLRGTLSF